MYQRTFRLQFKAVKIGAYLIGKLESLNQKIFQLMDCISVSNLRTQKFCRDLELRINGHEIKIITIKSFKI